MFISIDRDGKLALREPDDFKRLHVEASSNEVAREEIERALGSIATRDRDDFWIEIAALKQLGRAGDAAWEVSFDAMIASVRKFGWISPDGRRVRAHLKAG
jgi:hypothetical protein